MPCRAITVPPFSWGLRPAAPIPVGGKKAGEPAAPPSDTLAGAAGSRFLVSPPTTPSLSTEHTLSGGTRGVDLLRRRGAPEPADHPGRTRGADLLRCCCASGLAGLRVSQSGVLRRKENWAFVCEATNAWFFCRGGAKLSGRRGEAEGFGLRKEFGGFSSISCRS